MLDRLRSRRPLTAALAAILVAASLDDPAYPYSWLPPEDAAGEADELRRRGPEAFPD